VVSTYIVSPQLHRSQSYTATFMYMPLALYVVGQSVLWNAEIFFRLKTHFKRFLLLPGWPDSEIFGQFGDFLLWTFFESYRRSSIACATFLHVNSYALILTNIGWATLWAIFFTNSSGHPEGHSELHPWTPGVNLALRGEICPLGEMFTPSFTPRGEHSLLFRRMEGWTYNFAPKGQNSPLGYNFTPGVKLCP
jgi:hypothetical protein